MNSEDPINSNGNTDEATDPASAAGRRRKKWLMKIARLLVAAAILVYLFTHIQFGQVVDAILAADPVNILAAMAVAMLACLVIAHRLKRLTDAHGLTLSTLQVFEVDLTTKFFGLFLPGGNVSGIAVRFYKLSAAQQHFSGAAVSLVIDRIAATATLCAVGIFFWALAAPAGSWPIAMLMAAGLLVGLVALLLMLTHTKLPVVSAIERWLVARGGRKLAKIHNAILDARSLPRSTLLIVVLLAVITHLLGVGTYTLLAHAVGFDLSFSTVGYVRAGMILTTMIPISVAGLGLREGAAVALLSSYGVAGDSSVAFSLLAFAVTLLLPGMIGGLLEARRLWR